MQTMDLQSYLLDKLKSWRPPAPEIVDRSKFSITLDWSNLEPFQFLKDQLLYRIEKNEKYPPWKIVYRGGKTTKEIDNLASRTPHKFRLKVFLMANKIPTLADLAQAYYGSEDAVYQNLMNLNKSKGDKDEAQTQVNEKGDGKDDSEKPEKKIEDEVLCSGDNVTSNSEPPERRWVESNWSSLTWGCTHTDGSSIICFCMAVRCGYLKQVQSMLEERPSLIGIVNTVNGFTPLATAVRKGDINMVRFLLTAGAEVDQMSGGDQTPLHVAVLNKHQQIVDLLLEKGADFKAKDVNGLRVEHFAVDSGDVAMLRHILDAGGDVKTVDYNGWTPMFRAICQGASTEMIQELVVRGSDLQVADHAGLPLTSVTRLLVNRHGRPRESVLRLVDTNYPHQKALANFTRLTKKIYNVHSLFKLPVPNTQK